jgi:hypothetical protein
MISFFQSGRPDSNRRPPAPKAGALPGCATPRDRADPSPVSACRKDGVGRLGLQPREDHGTQTEAHGAPYRLRNGRAHADLRAYADVGGDREVLSEPDSTWGTTDEAIAEAPFAARVTEPSSPPRTDAWQSTSGNPWTRWRGCAAWELERSARAGSPPASCADSLDTRFRSAAGSFGIGPEQVPRTGTASSAWRRHAHRTAPPFQRAGPQPHRPRRPRANSRPRARHRAERRQGRCPLAYAHAVTGDTTAARRILADLLATPGPATEPFGLALAYVGLGEVDEAFRWLERGFDARAPFMHATRVTPAFQPLHRDRRWQALLQRMNQAL